MKKLRFIGIYIVVFTIFSCSKTIDSPPETPIGIKQSEMQNEKNAHDEEGFLHNEYLDHLGLRLEKFLENEVVDNSEIREATSSFYLDNYDSELNQEKFDELMFVYGELNENMILPGPDYIHNICDLVPSLCDPFPDQWPTTEFPFDILPHSLPDNVDEWKEAREICLNSIEQIRNFENDVMGTTEGEELKVLLTMGSVGRYSIGYWYNVKYVEKNSSKWHSESKSLQGVCVTCDIIKGDVGGAAVGAVVGGLGAGPGAAIGSGAVALEKLVVAIWKWKKG